MKNFYTRYKHNYSANLTLAIPVVISQLGHTLVQFADSIIVGHFAGTIPLAAVSLVNSIFTVIMVIGIGISYGLTPLLAQENGSQNFRECGKLLFNSLLINIISGIILFVSTNFGLLLMINDLHQSPDVVTQAKPFLGLISFSIIPLMVFLTFKQFAEGLGFTRQAMIISIAGNVLNVILGIIFVKGLFGFQPMGVRGVGLATLIDRALMAIIMSVYVFRSKLFKEYLHNFALKQISKISIKKILKIGAPVALQYAFEVSAFSGAAIMMGTIGVVQQAAHQVAINLGAMTYMMASGISAAVTVKCGNSFGRRDFKELQLAANASYHIVLAFMLFTAIVFVSLSNYLPWMYTTDTAVIKIASQLILIAALFQLFDGTQVVGLGVLRGMGDVNIPTIITFFAYWVIGLPVAYYLGILLNYGAIGIWLGLTIGLLTSAVLLFLRHKHSIKNLIIN